MDCCGEFRAHGQYGGGGAGAGWDYAPYALPYAPYAHYYTPHDPYRYYRYDYPHHAHHNDHAMPMEYGAYASKESRVRRAMARRDARALGPPSHHLPLPPTPPLECGMNGRNPYCEPQMWPAYQMGVGGWNGANAMGGAWMSRSTCSRDHMRYPADCRPFKGPHLHPQNQVCPPDGRSTPYPVYEESMYNGESNARHRNTPEYPRAAAPPEEARPVRDRERPVTQPRRSPPEEKRPPVVPLPAFQQAFGSTEIGKFAEAFSREVIIDDASGENYAFESFPEWDGPTEPQWSSQPASREIKCEDNY
ncbi:uncharacterized protein LOC126367229 [Pectinophora gossypiella]|uniref:uncharacterized protein LOC126367229 n=1 Tax=Pectinophora gossypiella TaxID=13191 RepID=UPI00214E72E7|nr:uncharacterized protein LOC126367229 [Pectinophora gossypiella]